MKPWSRVTALTLLLGCFGCSEGAKLVQETETGGVVTYPFKGESGYMFSKFRKEAMDLIEQHCAGRYTIVKEGEATGRTRISQVVEGAPEVVRERRWGLQFRCKP
ncbi:MAG: hypothetical protein EPO64_08825 [Nitrospirae bacterium]|nr:MAG: hypothetical protein EPO64_08825 [Nitrospirota bacterium]